MKKKLQLELVLVLVLVYECLGGEMMMIQGQGQGQGQKVVLKVVLRVMLSILFGSITGVSCALVSACLVRFVFRFMKKPPILKGPVVFSPLISPKSLQSALNSTTQLLLIGRTYYTTTLPHPIALKKLLPSFHTSSTSHTRRLQTHLHTLASLTHANLMTLRAYVFHNNTLLCLVYDYVPTGSLEDAIIKTRLNQLHIGWDARLRIAVGIIKALHYLHFSKILHYNLKPSNVLLDAHFEPTLTDSGLHTSAPPPSVYTEKSDIFSFGVILGILLTGRDPSDPLFLEVTSSSRGGGMGMWFRHLVEAGDAREALDKSLLGQETQEDEMLMAVRIAAVCLSDLPADRPSTDELVPMLTQLHSF
ncbi:hypothetical protein QVD17_42237 [Tagetes erecta]|uniref:Protein kinase domain-containing protein n=1 Tax=Tagetes erecta TaxID=13708 RepID=A0AAD8JK91_TARER|nr:hypothetical protein QVD17_42237 [Tagetes erecta]